ncbi:MAG: SUMF1/EgtB/PvdO family nonheme iron enzyme [Pseudomonadota bacterium]
MSSPEDEAERFDREGPQTEITFERGFWSFETPVTQALYKVAIGESRSRFEGPERPVEKVNWIDATTFLDQISGRIPGLELCRPSEAQWEYSCRAGSTTGFEPNVARTDAGASNTPDEVNCDGRLSYREAAQGKRPQSNHRSETARTSLQCLGPLADAW